MPNKYRTILILGLIFGLFAPLQAQKIEFSAQDMPIEAIFKTLQQKYHLQFSYNTALLKGCKISIDGKFKQPESLVKQILAQCDLRYKKHKQVFVILEKVQGTTPITTIPKPEKLPTQFFYRLKVVDANSRETLPFAHLQFGQQQAAADANGYFAYHCPDSLLYIKVAYLGYAAGEFEISPDSLTDLVLYPSETELQAVIIDEKELPIQPHTGFEAGLIKMNHQVANFIPGNQNNTIFNMMRLQAGVMAAGEQSKDFIIRGSYKGQSHVLFDGMTIFSNSSLNEQIGTINPLIIKDIELHKSGYNVHIGDRIGAVVDIRSKNGHRDAFQAELLLNNQSIGAYFNLPIKKKATIQLALRQAYPDIFAPETYKIKGMNSYLFSDINLKYQQKLQKGHQLSLSLLGNLDNNNINIEKDFDNSNYALFSTQSKHQLAGSLRHEKQWKKGEKLVNTLAYSQLNSTYDNKFSISDGNNSNNNISDYNFAQNQVSELRILSEVQFPANHWHQFSSGVGFTQYQSYLILDSLAINAPKKFNQDARVFAYMREQFSIGKFFQLEPGIRLDLPFGGSAARIQPRLRANFQPNLHWKVFAAYGLYHQFLVENPLLDDFGNYQYIWTAADDRSISIPQATHRILGTSYQNSHFLGQVEAFYNNTTGLTQLLQYSADSSLVVSKGCSRSYGVDMHLQWRIKKQQFWLAYTWSKTEELFDYSSNYQPAPQDQRHELKAVGLINLKPFFASASYVFGSGFPNANSLFSPDIKHYYSRLDLSVQYQKRFKDFGLELGLSVLNVMNTKNIQFNNFANFPNDKQAFNSATAFSPMLNVKVLFGSTKSAWPQ